MEEVIHIPFLDLKKVNQRYHIIFQKLFSDVLERGQLIKGNGVENFEKEFADFCGAKYCIGVGNGLDALTLILKGYIELGKINKGDEVLVASNTFIATILSVIHAGLTPVLIEPDIETYTMDPKCIKTKISRKTKVILPTYLYGQLASMDEINRIASEFSLLVVSDAAQAHGAKDHTGRNAGNICNASAFSFYPTKNLGAMGDGGAIVTNDNDLATIARRLGNYGTVSKYENNHIGYNSRLDEVQAVFLSEKLKNLSKDNARRREIARKYLTEIKNKKIILPYWDGSDNHVFHLFVVRVSNRNDFCNYLKEAGVGFGIHYPIAPHKQKALREFSYLSLPITEEIHDTIVSIPLHIGLTTKEINYIIKILNKYQ